MEHIKINYEDVDLVQASADQLTMIWTLNAASWAEPLSIGDHVSRERTLSEQPATSQKWITWALVLRADPSVVVSSVETFKRPVLVHDDTGYSERVGYGIASVFTNPKYRGNRMADLLLTRLKEWMDGEGNGWVSVLYSDIGKKFYEKLGWRPQSTQTLTLETDKQIWDMIQEQNGLYFNTASPLKREDLETLCQQDVEQLAAQLKSSNDSGGTQYAYPPEFPIIDWHIAREDLNASLIHGRWKPRFRGAISKSRRVWIIWHFDEIEHKLKVQRVVVLNKHERASNIKELAGLIRFAQWCANNSGFTTLLIWNPSEEIMEAVRLLQKVPGIVSVRIDDRDGSIPAARLRHDKRLQAINWIANEYYAWC